MTLAILVLDSPFSAQCAYSAFRFTEAALKSGQTIQRVFFYQNGVHTGSSLASPPQDEFDLYQAWQTLKSKYQLDLVVCIAAAARRGLVSEKEANRLNKPYSNLAPEFEVSGLGQLVEALAVSDRFITFGH
jgi:tRNA 2-thiouridine synthesizing protein D